MSAIPGSALDIKRRIAGGEPCPICGGEWRDSSGTQHEFECLYREYEHLRLSSIDRINSLTRQLRDTETALDRATRNLRDCRRGFLDRINTLTRELRATEGALDRVTRDLRDCRRGLLR